MKLCKDCRFLNGTKCDRESALVIDYVNGKNRQYDAAVHRKWKGKGDCGPEAKFFKATDAEKVS
jgi:hypothetical protein